MKANEITLGGTYAAKVNGRVVPVRVERADAWGYTFTNLITGRRSQCRSSAKFRYPVSTTCDAALSSYVDWSKCKVGA